MDEPCTDDSELEDEPVEPELQNDDFTTKHAFFIGGAMGLAYEEGLRARKRKKRKRFSDDGP